MSEKKPETVSPFFEDDSDEPTIVWVRPRRRLRGFTRNVHFLQRLHRRPVSDEPAEVDEFDDDEDTEPQKLTFEEDTRG